MVRQPGWGVRWCQDRMQAHRCRGGADGETGRSVRPAAGGTHSGRRALPRQKACVARTQRHDGGSLAALTEEAQVSTATLQRKIEARTHYLYHEDGELDAYISAYRAPDVFLE